MNTRTDDRGFAGGNLLLHEELAVRVLMSHCGIDYELPTRIQGYAIYSEFGGRRTSFNQSFSIDLEARSDENSSMFGVGEFVHPDSLTGSLMITCRKDPYVVSNIQLICGEAIPRNHFSSVMKVAMTRIEAPVATNRPELQQFCSRFDWTRSYARMFWFQNRLYFHFCDIDFESACSSTRDRYLSSDCNVELLTYEGALVGVNGEVMLEPKDQRECYPPMGVLEFRRQHSPD
ncbi:MAG: hypothetical protein MUF23_12350 [Pirellula sp.]|nr:hypothetical protein [Pirellula sp.]